MPGMDLPHMPKQVRSVVLLQYVAPFTLSSAIKGPCQQILGPQLTLLYPQPLMLYSMRVAHCIADYST